MIPQKPHPQKKKHKTKNVRSAKKKRTSLNCVNDKKYSTPVAIPVVTGSTPFATTTININTHAIPAEARTLPVATAYYLQPPQSRTTPRDRTMLSFHEELRSLTERIALNSDNKSLDPSECTCSTCPYNTGLLGLQRYNLMVRTFQINNVVSRNPHLRDSMW